MVANDVLPSVAEESDIKFTADRPTDTLDVSAGMGIEKGVEEQPFLKRCEGIDILYVLHVLSANRADGSVFGFSEQRTEFAQLLFIQRGKRKV